MNDYINREDAVAALAPAYGGGEDYVRKVIGGIPTADVAPVRHAQWIASYAEGETFEGFTERFVDSFRCSSCGNYAVPDSPYCPNCGAKMETDKEWLQ